MRVRAFDCISGGQRGKFAELQAAGKIVHRSTDARTIATRAGRACLATMLALAFVIASGAGCFELGGAAAQNTAWFQFGPVGDGPGTTNTYDPDFVREWEANPPKGYPTLAKANIAATKNAIQRYTNIVAQGGWPQLPEPPKKTPRDALLQYGITDAAVSLLRRRLAASGDLTSGNISSTYFDSDVEKALKRFQASNGLTPTGIADKRKLIGIHGCRKIQGPSI